jgi:hypothetical protein
MGDKNIIKDTIRTKNVPYFYITEKDVISFDLMVSLLDYEFTEDRLFEFGLLFGKDRYTKFWHSDYPSVEFYVIAKSMELVTLGQYKGWLKISLENATGFAFASPSPKVETYDFSNLTSTQTFTIDAKFNVESPKYGMYVFPTVLIDMKGSATSITIANKSDNNRTFGFTGLTTLESLTIDNENRQITSSTGNYRLGNMINNHAWFRFIYGRNVLTVNSPCILQFQTWYPVYI